MVIIRKILIPSVDGVTLPNISNILNNTYGNNSLTLNQLINNAISVNTTVPANGVFLTILYQDNSDSDILNYLAVEQTALGYTTPWLTFF